MAASVHVMHGLPCERFSLSSAAADMLCKYTLSTLGSVKQIQVFKKTNPFVDWSAFT